MDRVEQRIVAIGWEEKPSGCWEWKGERTQNAHGSGRAKINLQQGNRNVLRVLWELRNGVVQPGHMVSLTCRNPGCVNLDHAYVTTRAERMARERGQKRAPGSGRKPALTPAELSELVDRYQAEHITQQQLAAEYGVSEGVIQRAIKRAGVARAPGRRATKAY